MITQTPSRSVDLAATFTALGDPRRLAIIARLLQQDGLSLSDLCDGMDISRQGVSKHLKMLSDADLITSEKTGRETRYQLKPSRIMGASAFLDAVGTKWDSALKRLNTHVE